TSRVNKQVTTQKLSLDAAQDPGALLNGLQFTNLTLNKIPDPSAFNPGADSIGITFKFGMSTKDNVTPALNGDYDPARYSPIDFRFNDSTRAKYVLSSYYAYDDGSAEYGAGLNQPGSYLAFKFTSKNSQPDTLSYVDIYFPEFGDNTSQSLELYVWSTLLDAPSTVFLYKQTIQVKRQTQNKFTRYVIDPAPLIKGDYHIGWKQLSSASIPVGLDKNNDNGEKIFFNIGGDWVQNVNVKGTAMVRPGFFRPQRVQLITSVEADRLSPVFPNPTQGTCFLPAEAGNVQVFDQMGRPVYSEAQADRDHTRLIISAGFSGLAIIRYTWRGNYRTEKVMVQAH
ncbi:MAG: T9SS type A sorting domain-containing protein, partial [Cyclobacteriaceae bacterium]|nr:T9SS type A sorting domain-containing protein [Cyclobacteriaceae bacterium]